MAPALEEGRDKGEQAPQRPDGDAQAVDGLHVIRVREKVVEAALHRLLPLSQHAGELLAHVSHLRPPLAAGDGQRVRPSDIFYATGSVPSDCIQAM